MMNDEIAPGAFNLNGNNSQQHAELENAIAPKIMQQRYWAIYETNMLANLSY